ncbi:hypothetical protein VTL71DRAFT_308 [Oculimacula yallundae]|uniref:Gas1-like protein n=1 Tax=Oculimacula yallundae TaxID=86028 RepID=A0ABR4CZS3_9HELO
MISSVFYAAALFSVANAHGVLMNAQGEAGSPPSIGFQVNNAIARNCTGISPCQLDTTIIRDAEIKANVVNECGRTQLTGNIDIGENTENALAAKQVTSVKAGTPVQVTIHQVNADGAGPYVCDMEEASNNGVFTHNLTVTNNVPGANGLSQAKFQDFNITVTMPTAFNCKGASVGTICTVRCRNIAQAGPFGGCFAVRQIDGKASANTPETITSALTAAAALAQVQQNQLDLDAANKANQVAPLGAAALKAAGAEAPIVSLPAEVNNVDRPNTGGAGAGAPPAAAPAATPTPAAGGKAKGAGKGAAKGAGKGAANGATNGGKAKANGQGQN